MNNQTLIARRQDILRHSFTDEDLCVQGLLRENQLSSAEQQQLVSSARQLTDSVRQQHSHSPFSQFLQSFNLASSEGIAMMCLAEALLRTPDNSTRDTLIEDILNGGDWQDQLDHDYSLFANAPRWGLVFSRHYLIESSTAAPSDSNWGQTLNRLFKQHLGTPFVRQVLQAAINLLCSHYILAESVEAGVSQAARLNKKATTRQYFSFDILGEGARTQACADRYLADYQEAIATLAAENTNHKATCNTSQSSTDKRDDNSKLTDTSNAPLGLSIKLSALHPRYHASQQRRLQAELLPRLLQLCRLAAAKQIPLTIDAEETTRLMPSLQLIEQLLKALSGQPELRNWQGLGVAVQAYQKRAPWVIRWLAELARQQSQKISVRLVKGAYWDQEIKFAQQQGLDEFPVFTRKDNTDLNYQICTQLLFEYNAWLRPQFATHNAYTLCIIEHLSRGRDYELQRLYGMGESLYQQYQQHNGQRIIPVRIYAPIGERQTLLPYLVRRMLENGANNSFVQQLGDPHCPTHQLVTDINGRIYRRETEGLSHVNMQIARPADLFKQQPDLQRDNSSGCDLSDPVLLEDWQSLLRRPQIFDAAPLVAGEYQVDSYSSRSRYSQADLTLELGQLRMPMQNQDLITLCRHAFGIADAYQPQWAALPIKQRADLLESIAQQYQQQQTQLLYLLVHEAGKTLADGLNEIREAIDFCYYYSAQARQLLLPQTQPGPSGEDNQWQLCSRGIFACISPWNFPLAIFTGQIVAALVSGNCVIAKPASPTPLIAHLASQLMYRAGIPTAALQLLLGPGEALGQQLLQQSQLAGIAFTGSTDTAQQLYRGLAQRAGAIVPLIAETGGINAMIADSSALPEQLVDDIIQSAFLSAGQRCSALRLLYLQNDNADTVLDMLYGACEQLTLSPANQIDCDIGPLINTSARQQIEAYLQQLPTGAKLLYRYDHQRLPADGNFLGPHIIELQDFTQLTNEIFGPVLHVIRYHSEQLTDIVDDINRAGYGLTLGIHSRADRRAQQLAQQIKVGNVYINRNMTGAIVGSQPFGGRGLSGTGPKAGGPHYLPAFCCEKTITTNTAARGGDTTLLNIDDNKHSS